MNKLILRFVVAVFFLNPMVLWAADLEFIGVSSSSETVVDRTNFNPRISGDGRLVVFESRLLSRRSRSNQPQEIYLVDRENDTVERVEPPLPDQTLADPTVSESGRYVAYVAYPLSVVTGEPPIVSDVWIYDRLVKTSRIQTFDLENIQNDGEHIHPVLNQDGRYLVFTSNATLFPGLKNGLTRAVYVFDFATPKMELISQSVGGDPANRPSGDPQISRDGRFVAFKSAATNLLHPLPLESLAAHLYLWDRQDKTMMRIDEATRGFNSDQYNVGRYAIDARGETIVFEGRSRLAKDPSDKLSTTDLFIADRSTHPISRLTKGIFSGRSHSPTLSGDGRFLAFVFRGTKQDGEKVAPGLIIYDLTSRTWEKVVSASCRNPQISSDGCWVVFESEQKNLVAGAPPKGSQIYLVTNPLHN